MMVRSPEIVKELEEITTEEFSVNDELITKFSPTRVSGSVTIDSVDTHVPLRQRKGGWASPSTQGPGEGCA